MHRSTSAPHFEKVLQAPAYAEPRDGADDCAQRLPGRIGSSAAIRQCIADEGEADGPDPDSEFHGRRMKYDLSILLLLDRDGGGTGVSPVQTGGGLSTALRAGSPPLHRGALLRESASVEDQSRLFGRS